MTTRKPRPVTVAIRLDQCLWVALSSGVVSLGRSRREAQDNLKKLLAKKVLTSAARKASLSGSHDRQHRRKDGSS